MSFPSQGTTSSNVPVLAVASTGIGARTPHYDDILQTRPDVGWLEVHSENFFNAGGPPLQYLEKLRTAYPLSFHGVGLSLGSACGLCEEHLSKLKSLTDRFNPVLVSEHLSWSGAGGRFVPDLLPLPMTYEALDILARNIDQAQTVLGRKILIENPSGYLAFIEQDMTETEFLKALVQKTGCGLLLDVNNIYVSAHNIGFDAEQYLSEIPPESVEEIHLAGYQVNNVDEKTVFIDAHNNPVHDGVWNLYKKALEHIGNTATLIEWDNDLPTLNGLLNEARKADTIRESLFTRNPAYVTG